MFRGINAVYTQAPQVRPGTKDASDFLFYCQIVYEFIHDHHTLEEKVYFPQIEKIPECRGMMEENLEQHRKLEIALGKLNKYATTTAPESYDAGVLRKIIDGIVEPLNEHLFGEIPTILDLWDKLDSETIRKIYKDMTQEAAKSSNLFKAAPFVLGCQDRTFLLDGIYIDFPELPSHAVHYVVDWVVSRKHAGAWRFNPSTMYGNVRMTPFFPAKGLVEKPKS